jgi:predicted lipid-binding transport protein (Tim44 family)
LPLKRDGHGSAKLERSDLAPSAQLNENAPKGVRGMISDVKLLQGDLSEAWREGASEYATVAMRYAITEQVIERTGDKLISGGTEEATEVWTFRRDHGGTWKLYGVQQTA